MIKINTTPYECSFTKNNMIFEVNSSSYFPTKRVMPFFKIRYSAVPSAGKYWRFDFINPETGVLESIKVTAKATPLNPGDVLDSTSGLTVSAYKDHVLATLKEIKVLNAYFTLEIVSTDIVITAKLADAALEPINILYSSASGFTITYSPDFYEPIERAGYQLTADVFVEDVFMSGNFNFIASMPIALDTDANGKVNVSVIVGEGIEKTWDAMPIPDRTLAYYFPKITRRYYVKFTEKWADNTNGNSVKSKLYFAQWGGHSTDNANEIDPFAALDLESKLLTSIPSGKIVHETQDDWCTFINTSFTRPVTVEIYVTNNLNVESLCALIFEDDMLPWQCITFQTGFNFYDLLSVAGVSGLKYWTIRVSDGIGTNYVEDYRYYLSEVCLKHTLLFFNNYGCPETFYTNGEWVENLDTIKNVAVRSKQFNQSALRPNLFVFGKTNTSSVKAISQPVENEVAKRLQVLLNTSVAYLWEENTFVPVLVEANSAEVDRLGEFTQNIEMQILKANINQEISFLPSTPKLVAEFDGQYTYTIAVEKNNFKIATFGNLEVYKDGTLFTTVLWNGTTLKYNSFNIATSGKIRIVGALTNIDGTVHNVVLHFQHEEVKFSFDTTLNTSNTFTIDRMAASSTTMLMDTDSGAAATTVSLTPITNVTISFASSISKKVTFYRTNFNDFTGLTFTNIALKNIKLDVLKNLTKIVFSNCSLGSSVFLNNMEKLEVVTITSDATINFVDIGYMPNLSSLSLNGLALTTEAIELIIERIWIYRNFKNVLPTISITGIVSPVSAKTTAMLNGTGDFVNQGLIADLGYPITIS